MGLETVISNFGSLFGFLLPFAAALFIIVFIHEYGHYIVGRWCGVKVDEFSIGFGPELIGWNAKKTGTRWKICLFPIGGYVKFEGDANAASVPDAIPDALRSRTSFPAKAVWQRALIVAAGPVANFLLAIAIFTFVFAIYGTSVTNPVIGKVIPGGAASEAKLQAGDVVRKINGTDVETFNDVVYLVRFRPDEVLNLSIERDGKLIEVVARTKVESISDNFGGTLRLGRLGIESDGKSVLKKLSLAEALEKGVTNTWRVLSTSLRYMKKILFGEESSKMIGGPISIAKGAGDAARSGVLGFTEFIAFISVSIGMINLFPIPLLDGGHLVFYAVEAIRGKPLGAKAQEWGMRLGFSLVIMLMIFGTMNDFLRLGSLF